MSFTTKEHIQRLIEGLLNHVWPENLQIPFPEMKYKDAMENYGVDKPDTRFDNLVIWHNFLIKMFSCLILMNVKKLQDVTELAKASEMSQIFRSSELVDFSAIGIVFKSAAVSL